VGHARNFARKLFSPPTKKKTCLQIEIPRVYRSAKKELNLPNMPKAPTCYSIVREIRIALGLTQEELAARLGVYISTIRKVENGTLDISEQLARSLSSISDVATHDILTNRAGELRTRFKRGVTPRLLLDRDRRAQELSAKDRKTLFDNYLYQLELLIDAIMVDRSYLLWTLDDAITLALHSLEDRFDLKEAIKKLRAVPLDPKVSAYLARMKLPEDLKASAVDQAQHAVS
jgi:transcriptional regulator with XRE-family HTH domain